MTDPSDLRAFLEAHLPVHLARQRWSGVHDRPVASVALRWCDPVATAAALGDPSAPVLLWVLADVAFHDGGRQAYQLFLGVRPAEDDVAFLHGKDRELVGVPARSDGREVVVYDGLVDPDLAVEVLRLVAPEVTVEVPRPIVLEHSNSSLVFDEAHILKVLRKVEPGPNPDVEITRVLAERGCEQVLAPLAELRRDGIDLAVVRRFVVGATEGWALALASVKDVLAGRVTPAESGADFSGHAERLGRTVGTLHVALADAWPAEPGDGPGWRDAMVAHLAEVPGLDAVLAPAGADRAALTDRYDALAALADVGAQVRVHGDLHLAQVLLVDQGWLVLDFEGEPARRRDDRFTVSSPLRDVAGLLRSLHYAAAVGLLEWGDPDDEQRALAATWELHNRRALLDGYLTADGVGSLLPSDPAARAVVLAAFELDKAVYEVAYELGHRPDQVGIPVAGVTRLLAEGGER